MVSVAVGAVVSCAAIKDVVVAAPPGFEDEVSAAVAGLGPAIVVVPGGPTRQASVAAALTAIDRRGPDRGRPRCRTAVRLSRVVRGRG